MKMISILLAVPVLTRGPFVQMPEPNKPAIVWRTDVPAGGTVDYGLDAACTNGTVNDASSSTEHVLGLPGLVAGTNYFYRVRTGGAVLSDGNVLRTPRAPGQPFRFVVIGDWGDGSAAMTNVARRINAVPRLDFYVTVGDNIYENGEAKLYDPYWFSLYGPTMRRVPVFPALGNHDVRPASSNGQPFLEFFHLPRNGPAGLVGRNYSFDYGNAHFVAIDSNPFADKASLNPASARAITDWVRRDLAATRQPWKFAYFHHPPFTSQAKHTDSEMIKSQLVPVFEAAGVQMVFTGHNHIYERFEPIHGVVYIISGAGGAKMYPVEKRASGSAAVADNVHSFTLVDIAGDRLKLSQIDETGRVLDTFEMRRR